ncbi:hypothetical protein [Streptomyces albidus (ex Kaewkla and Franco 2022)]|uniref:hypothetical protein n=1 Tax=Streptomyces albidus (ex Kaewkla and Franco 2022) TaxID=722709 RepID=UPI001F333604|nr:hypothetical protein [Streptomyces albidus (ex Kaewkla and Franco 2022)]
MERNPGAEDHGPGEDPEPEHDPEALPLDEEAAWAAIVAAYGEQPRADEMAPAAEPGGDARSPARPAGSGAGPEGEGEGDEGGTAVRSFTVYSAGSGPRDWAAPAGDDQDEGGAEDGDEGHFVPPEPPPLPESDPTTRFAWLAVVGGPLLLIFTILFQQDFTWWIATLGLGGFLGGFATLVARMRDGRDEDDWDDPGRGAVV